MITTASLFPVGQLGKTHGLKGEIRFRPYRPFFSDLLQNNLTITVGTKQLTLISCRETASFLLLKFRDIDTPEKAQFHVNQELWFPLEAVEAITPEPINFPERWIGWDVVEQGKPLGTVKDILQSKANDILTVQNEAGDEWLVPVIDEYILHVDPETKTLTVKKPVLV